MPLSGRRHGNEVFSSGLAHRFALTSITSRPVDMYAPHAYEHRRDATWGPQYPGGWDVGFSSRDGADPRAGHVGMTMAGLRLEHHNAKTNVRSHPYYCRAPLPSHRVIDRYATETDTNGSCGSRSCTEPSGRAGSQPSADNNRFSLREWGIPNHLHSVLEDALVSTKRDNETPWRGGLEEFATRHDTSDAIASGPEKPASSPQAAGSTAMPKKSRYLREMDRRIILSRLAAGEKQSDLAKEYNVSRSTICNLFRQREIVLARKGENPMARHPKKPRKHGMAPNQGDKQRGAVSITLHNPDHGDHVVEVQSLAITLLKQNLLDRRTPRDEFKRCCSRLMRLLIEESLAILESRFGQRNATPSRSQALDERVCAVSIEETGRAMLDTFCQLEPRAPSGMLSSPSRGGLASLPVNLSAHNVLLLGVVAASGHVVSAAVEKLLAQGAHEHQISLVALFVSPEVVTQVQHTYPRVQILTTGIEALTIDQSSTLSSTVGVFLDRFQGAVWNGNQVLWTAN